jgi:hypothetical protein
MSQFKVRANRTMGARSVSIASSIQAGSGSALRPRKIPLNRMARLRIVAKAVEPALRASTFLACSAVIFPLGFMQSAAAISGDIACPVSGSRTGSRIWSSPLGLLCSCFSARRHRAKSRCKFDRLPSFPRRRIKVSNAFPLRMPLAQLCFRYSSKYHAGERLTTARFRSGGVSNCSHFATLRRGNPVRRPISLQVSHCRCDPLGFAPKGAKGIVAGEDAGAQDDPGRGRRTGEQDGARHPGDADARRKLSRSLWQDLNLSNKDGQN